MQVESPAEATPGFPIARGPTPRSMADDGSQIDAECLDWIDGVPLVSPIQTMDGAGQRPVSGHDESVNGR
jgi:hypothetical protein